MSMSASAAPQAGWFGQSVAALGGARSALATVGRTELRWAALIIALGTLLSLLFEIEGIAQSLDTARIGHVAVTGFIDVSVGVLLGLAFWAIADRAPPGRLSRPMRFALALVGAGAIHALVVPPLIEWLVGAPQPCFGASCPGHSDEPVGSYPLYHVAVSVDMMILGALLFAWLEVQRRNRAAEARLAETQRERTRLGRETFDARLAAMQAQVDPQFLFDTLVDVEAAYTDAVARGAELLDRLIVFLRAALPRLRAEGSTIEAEAGLVEAWLAVMSGRRDGFPPARIVVAPGCAAAFCLPMTLLPLVQWAAGDPERPPGSIALEIGSALGEEGAGGARQMVARLRIEGGRRCVDEPMPAAVRERLRTRYGGAARLDCTEIGRAAATPPCTQLTLLWPDEKPDRDRR
ncbi:MAG TPA: histidine kinase [Burkholderiaceae bacterium]